MALESFGTSLKRTFRKITGLGVVDKESVEMVVKELQRTLLQADVDIKLVVELSNKIKKAMLESGPPNGMTMKEYFIKTLYNEMVSVLGSERGDVALKPQSVLVMGLFGSGKTTSIAKIAKWFKSRGLSVGVVACDTHRAAAQDQLNQLADKLLIPCYRNGRKPEDIAQDALSRAREDVLIFDSAGRDALDGVLAEELKELGRIIKPDEALLVIPADIGQAARRQSEEFNKLVGITGIFVTKLDGTAKGGGALAAAAVSGAKVKFIGTGEKPEDIEQYDPQRFFSRLIGYGDIQGLLEKAEEAGVGAADAAQRIMRGEFTMSDFYEQIKSMQKMGPLSKITEMIPGIGNLKLPAGMLDIQQEKMAKWGCMIDSMTEQERKNPEEIKHGRIKRIAQGSGTTVTEVNELMKNYKQIKKVMKMTKGGKAFRRGPFAKLAKQMGLGT